MRQHGLTYCQRKGKWKIREEIGEEFSHLAGDDFARVFANRLHWLLDQTAHVGIGKLSKFHLEVRASRRGIDGVVDYVEFVVKERRAQPLLRAFFAPLLLIQHGIAPWGFFLKPDGMLARHAKIAAEFPVVQGSQVKSSVE